MRHTSRIGRALAAMAIPALLLAGCAVATGDDAHPIAGEGNPGIGESDGIIVDADGNPLRDDGTPYEDPDPELHATIVPADNDDCKAPRVGATGGDCRAMYVNLSLPPGVTDVRFSRWRANCARNEFDGTVRQSARVFLMYVYSGNAACWTERSWATWNMTATFSDGSKRSTIFELKQTEIDYELTTVELVCWDGGTIGCTPDRKTSWGGKSLDLYTVLR